MNGEKPLILSLGGSRIIPKSIDVSFLKQFLSWMKSKKKTKERVVIVCGGGHTAREYISAGKNFQLHHIILDELGIASTKLNALFVLSILQKQKYSVYPKIVQSFPNHAVWKKYQFLIASGNKPGHSTDYCAVEAAKKYGVTSVINVSNVDGVYTKDPKLAGAKKLPLLTWTDFEKLFPPNSYSAGMHTPFDPKAAQLAKKNNITVSITDSFQKQGTLVQPVSRRKKA